MTNPDGCIIITTQNKEDGIAALTLRIRFVRSISVRVPPGRLFCECGHFASALCLFYPEVLHISTKEMQINEDIRDREVRVVTDGGEQLGIMSAADALKIATQRNLDLVKIAPQAKPPVCKIMDYGKYRFEQQKREKEAKKNQHQIDIKEVQLSLNIDTHDLETKANHANKFLKQGNKVKVSIRFRGREMAHPERGHEIMAKFAEMCAENGNIEKPSKLEGRMMLMFLAAKPVK